MTWPPAELPIDFQNATPQENTHPDAHNATNQTINADLVPEIIRVGELAETIGLYLPLTGGTLTGDLQVGGQTEVRGNLEVDGNSDLKINVPADFWAPDSGTVFGTFGMLGGSQGSYATSMTSNGYRNTGGKWTSIGAGGNTGAVQISLLPTGTFEVRTAANHPTGSASHQPTRFTVTDTQTIVHNNLKVDGQTKAQNGTKAAPAYSFTSDTKTGVYLENASSFPSASIISLTANGVNVANFGDKGVSLPTVYAATTSAPPNLHISTGGELLRSTAVRVDTADIERLEAVIDKLSARIEELEGLVRPAAKPAAS